MTIDSGNLFAGISGALADEQITTLLSGPNVRIERIVSHGHSSPPGFWYDQDQPEWVIVVAGSAAVLFDGESAPRALRRGDYLHIPAHARHRVEWTDKDEPTIWIAVHHG
ncbi:MAG: cupin domain-containing protein [Xanthobacteraceae bacterium]|nr:cupin domain-containing protein [Xanthobacteraceae bacterium]